MCRSKADTEGPENYFALFEAACRLYNNSGKALKSRREGGVQKGCPHLASLEEIASSMSFILQRFVRTQELKQPAQVSCAWWWSARLHSTQLWMMQASHSVDKYMEGEGCGGNCRAKPTTEINAMLHVESSPSRDQVARLRMRIVATGRRYPLALVMRMRKDFSAKNNYSKVLAYKGLLRGATALRESGMTEPSSYSIPAS